MRVKDLEIAGAMKVLNARTEAGSAVKRLVIRAFRTEAIGTISIVFAESAGKARYATMLGANDAGWDVEIPEISVKRASEFDQRKYRQGYMQGFTPEIGRCHKQEDLLHV